MNKKEVENKIKNKLLTYKELERMFYFPYLEITQLPELCKLFHKPIEIIKNKVFITRIDKYSNEFDIPYLRVYIDIKEDDDYKNSLANLEISIETTTGLNIEVGDLDYYKVTTPKLGMLYRELKIKPIHLGSNSERLFNTYKYVRTINNDGVLEKVNLKMGDAVFKNNIKKLFGKLIVAKDVRDRKNKFFMLGNVEINKNHIEAIKKYKLLEINTMGEIK